MEAQPSNGTPDPLAGKHLELTYPCPWTYTLIGPDEAALQQAVSELLGERLHELAFSHASRGGKYVSMNLELEVNDEADRHGLFHALKQDSRVLHLI